MATAAQKAAAKKAAAKKAAATKAATAKKVAAKKEAAYIKSFSNPITSQYDPRITANALRPTTGGDFEPYSPWKAKTPMTSVGVAPKATTVEKVIPEPIDTIDPGSGGGDIFEPTRTLAFDTFRNTLAIIFGPKEASQPWVNEIFGLASGFYKSGSSISESLNLSLYEAKAKGLAPQFTKRFEGVFKLQERLQKGEAIAVPTIAEFIKSESDIGDILREVGMPELANQEFLGGILGRGKSVSEVGTLINDVFMSIKNAPSALKADLRTNFPGIDDVAIAKALLLGEQGTVELKKKIANLSVQSAAKTQGLTVDLASAGDIAAMGFGYNESLQGFGTVSRLKRADALASFVGRDFSQQQAQNVVFGKSAAGEEKLRLLTEQEQARFAGSSGLAASALRGKTSRTAI